MSRRGGAGLGAGFAATILLGAATLLGCSNLTTVDSGLAAIEVRIPHDSVEVGQTLQLSARALNANGDSVAATIVWRTPDTAVTVDSTTGLVTGVTAGTGRVQAVSGSLASELVALTVVTPPPTGP